MRNSFLSWNYLITTGVIQSCYKEILQAQQTTVKLN